MLLQNNSFQAGGSIAIVGAGFAGLSVCWHLATLGICSTLFDPRGIGGGASGVSTGLLHPFAGRRACRSWGASDGMREAEDLLAIAETALGAPVAEKTGIFRPVLTGQQRTDFMKCAKKHKGAEWLDDVRFGSGLWIAEGISVYSRLYLQGLWKACQQKGALLVQESVPSLSMLENFDQTVLTTGADTLAFASCKDLPLKNTKGQTLICRWPERLPFSLVSHGHITPTEDEGCCQIGSTYEEHYTSALPDSSIAITLKEKIAQFYPPARDFEVLEVRSAVRIARLKGYRPVVRRLDAKSWVFTGLGSRGLLYHGWIGKAVAKAIAENSAGLDPIFESVCL
ncbi:MAG: FAD-binding oxidoreductase [Chlamydiia bacterium]|nr:FAD-binding oxidoreductase [Chlamydiia bacterium]